MNTMKQTLFAGVMLAALAGTGHAAPPLGFACAHDPNIDARSPLCPGNSITVTGPAFGFREGYADRKAWEDWFNATSGEFKAGAYWWSGQRSLPQPGDCQSLGGQATSGCLAAKAQLEVSDYRRNAFPIYRAGWNSYSADPVAAIPPPPVPASPAAFDPATVFSPPVVTPPAPPPTVANPAEVPISMRNGGGVEVWASINSTTRLSFMVDSGAGDVSIPQDMFDTMMTQGVVTPADFRGVRTYVMANGTKDVEPVYVLASVTVGNRTAVNVLCSVGVKGSGLLLGQSFLKKFRSWSIDNERSVLVLDD
jgi:hypothetical protein